MTTHYEQSYPSNNPVSQLSYLRLPNHSSLHLHRFHPYGAACSQTLSSSADAIEPVEDCNFESNMLQPVSVSLPVISEDDCMAGLRAVVSEMIGWRGTVARIQCVELVIDFALAVRRHSRKEKDAVVHHEIPAIFPSGTA
ncbi:hypothetical protein BU15DRAFT_70835 [Melanogaster broomeanus]|nr:hypothetical protein BU15DRAFT_70835 [Melanogaster broomeanus]